MECARRPSRKLSFALLTLAAVLLMGGMAHPVAAEELIIGFRGDAATLDPHMRSETTTLNLQAHIYDYLFNYGVDGSIKPHLGLSLENVDDTTWLLHLRQGVQFTNGEPFNAEAAAYSINRAKTHPRSQTAHFLAAVERATPVDEYTVEITTLGPRPLLLLDLTHSVMMVPPRYVEEVGDAEFALKPVGTGAYIFEEWVRDQHLKLTVNPDWWGWQEGFVPDITRVTMRPIPETATRVAALVTGEIHVAESIAVEDIPRVEASPDHYVARTPSQRVIYLTMDYFREKDSPGMAPGQPNPFMDRRVRQAVYHAINKDEIIEFVMGGAAYPADQFVHPNAYGFNPNLKGFPHDPDRARELLREAGYPQGFRVRIDVPNDRYINDADIAQAVAGQLRQVGIDAWVNATPRAEFFPRVDNGDFTVYIAGWGSLNLSATLNAQLRCRDPERGLGHVNRLGYCNPAFDELVARADVTFDEEERTRLYHEAIRVALDEDVVWVPLHYEEIVAGIDARFDIPLRFDEMFFAYETRVRR